MDHGDDEGKSELAEEAEEGPSEISRTDTELRSGRKNTSSEDKAIQIGAVSNPIPSRFRFRFFDLLESIFLESIPES